MQARLAGRLRGGARPRRERDAERAPGRRVAGRRMATPDEVAACFVFLASDLAGFVSGVTLVVDGGEVP